MNDKQYTKMIANEFPGSSIDDGGYIHIPDFPYVVKVGNGMAAILYKHQKYSVFWRMYPANDVSKFIKRCDLMPLHLRGLDLETIVRRILEEELGCSYEELKENRAKVMGKTVVIDAGSEFISGWIKEENNKTPFYGKEDFWEIMSFS